MSVQKRTVKSNGTKPVVENRLAFSPEELNLIHQCLVQLNFPDVQSKQIAASAQARIEQFIGQ